MVIREGRIEMSSFPIHASAHRHFIYALRPNKNPSQVPAEDWLEAQTDGYTPADLRARFCAILPVEPVEPSLPRLRVQGL